MCRRLAPAWGRWSAFSPSTISRRVHRRLEGLPQQGRGRPRDDDAPRRARRLQERLDQSHATLTTALEALAQSEEQREQACLRQIIGLIFHGNSLRGTAECLQLGFPDLAPQKSAIGQRLSQACELAKALYKKYFSAPGLGKLIVGACDEIYISGAPILEIIEPRSLAIVGLSTAGLSKDNWSKLLDEVCETIAGGVSDQGLSVAGALEKAVLSWFDAWHLLREFSSLVGRLEQAAYYWIELEQQRCREFVASLPYPAGSYLPPALKRLEEAQEKCRRSIDLYDQASIILGFLYEAARPIDEFGRLKTAGRMQADWEAALDLTSHINAPSIWSAADKLRGKIDGKIVKVLEPLLKKIALPPGWKEPERERLQSLACKAWLYHHKHYTHLLLAPQLAAQWMATQLDMPFIAPHLEGYCTTVFELLDRVPIASSAVECVNSIIRLRQGGKRHPHPDFIYLLAWLHNTRAFTEGRRKGLTPAQLLGIQLPHDGWDMLFNALAAKRASCN